MHAHLRTNLSTPDTNLHLKFKPFTRQLIQQHLTLHPLLLLLLLFMLRLTYNCNINNNSPIGLCNCCMSRNQLLGACMAWGSFNRSSSLIRIHICLGRLGGALSSWGFVLVVLQVETSLNFVCRCQFCLWASYFVLWSLDYVLHELVWCQHAAFARCLLCTLCGPIARVALWESRVRCMGDYGEENTLDRVCFFLSSLSSSWSSCFKH